MQTYELKVNLVTYSYKLIGANLLYKSNIMNKDLHPKSQEQMFSGIIYYV